MKGALIALMVAASGSAGGREEGLTFHASFDGRLTADWSAGSAEPTVHGRPRFVEGRSGKAVVVTKDDWLQYASKGNLNPGQGAIEFWLKPLDWDGTDETTSHFFVGAAGRDRLYVYKFVRWRKFTFHINPAAVKHYESLAAPIYKWERGRWRHAVVTWDRVQMRIYLDGKLAVHAPLPAPLTDLGEALCVGKDLATPQWAGGETALDELRVYGRPLFAEEVARAYRRIEDRQAGVVHEPVRDAVIYYTGYPSTKRATLRFVTSFLTPPGAKASLVIRHAESKADVLRQAVPVEPAGALADCDISTEKLSSATYNVTLDVHEPDGTARLEKTVQLVIRDRFWQGAGTGIPKRVPPPWTPLVADARRIGCWDRYYTLGNGGRIDRITSAGRELLARPLGLVGSADGRELRADGPWRLAGASPLEARYETTLAAPKLEVRVRMTAEFDGFLRLDYTVTPDAGGAAVERLALEMPLRPDIARYLHTSSQFAKYYTSGEVRRGAWPADDVFNVWLGDEDRGLSWVCEGAHNWPNQDRGRQIEVVPGKEAALVRVNLVAEPTTLKEPFTVSFGIQATPVRPMPEGWRRLWRLSPQVGENPSPKRATDYLANVAVIWWSARPDTPRWFAFPEPTDPAAFRKLVNEYHRRGVKVIVYENLTNLSPNVPEYAEYAGEWLDTPKAVPLRAAGEPAPPERWDHVKLTRPDWADFLVGHQARTIERYDVDGWYFDCAVPYPVGNIHPVFDYREACKRAYVAVKERKPDGLVITHCSSHFMPAALAFSDAYLEGEQFRWRLPAFFVTDDYTKVLPLDFFRTELTGRQLGCVPVFLPEFPGRGHRTRRNTEHLLALTQLHDVPIWPVWCDPDPVRELWAALDRFGIGAPDVEFLPYWQHPAPAETDAEDVHISAYRRPGRAVLVVSNYQGHREATARVKPHLGRLGVAADGLVTTDLVTGELLRMADGHVTLTVPEGRARVVLLKER